MAEELKIVPLGGLGEIGMNCLILECKDEMIMIDCGVLFSDNPHFGIDFIVPDFQYVAERKDKFKGLFVTHGHEDHIGAIPYMLRAGIEAPIYCSPFARRLVEDRLVEHGLAGKVEIKNLASSNHVEFRRFKVTSYTVNHSIVEALALIVDTPAGKVVHTGDFKIDPDPHFGETTSLTPFEKAGEEGVFLLLSDSTNVDRDNRTPPEKGLIESFERQLVEAQGYTVASMFSSNVARMAQFFDLAAKLGKKVAITGRSIEKYFSHASELGYLKNASQSLIEIDDIESFDRKDVIVLCSGTQCEFGSAMNRIAYGEHSQLQLDETDQVIMSSRIIPGHEKIVGRAINEMIRQKAKVHYEPHSHVHVSGHATRPELEMMIKACKPKFFVPVHGEYRHLVKHVEVAKSCGISEERSAVLVNGDVMKLSRDGFELEEHIEDHWKFVEIGGKIIGKDVLKVRRKIAETGIAIPYLSMKNGRMLGEVDILDLGVFGNEMEVVPGLIESAQKHLSKVASRYQRAPEESEFVSISEALRIELRRYLHKALNHKPVVLPVVTDTD